MNVFLDRTDYERFSTNLNVREQAFLENLCQLSFEQVHIFFKDCLKNKEKEKENK